jgi:hypothetical protein
MNRFLFAGLCALAAGWAGTSSAEAQCVMGRCDCGALCAHMFPFMFQHGPLINYSAAGCGYGGCGHGGCGHGGWGDPGHGWGGGHNGFFGGGHGGCSTCGTGGWGGHGFHHGGGGSTCDTCGSSDWGHYARTTYVNVFARLHPTASHCGQSCGLSCGSSCNSCGGHAWGGGRTGGGCSACGGHGHIFGGHGGGCDSCGHGGGGLRARLGGHGGGDGCGGGCGHGGGHFGHHGGFGGGYGGGGLQSAPWYLYWPTPDNQFQVPGPNAAGWSGNHWVLPAPYGYGTGAYGSAAYGQASGINPYFPSFGPGR